ncbi:MAG: GNAT family N-acetyltransferase [Chthoniobacterales bacterium]|nr:MAG: GNAT family N-acetyltransferase [Chthoniobacterales bacterium]
MHIVRAKPEDAAVLTEIAFAAKSHWGYPQEWIESWRDVLTMRPEFLKANEAWCALEDNQVLGFYVLTTESDGLHLDHLWIRPSAMGRGIGRDLFEHAVRQGKELRHIALRIEVDPNAEGFYQRMGARRVGTNTASVGETRRELPLLIYDL